MDTDGHGFLTGGNRGNGEEKEQRKSFAAAAEGEGEEVGDMVDEMDFKFVAHFFGDFGPVGLVGLG